MSHIATFWFLEDTPAHSGTKEPFDDSLVKAGLLGDVAERYSTPNGDKFRNVESGDKSKEGNIFILRSPQYTRHC